MTISIILGNYSISYVTVATVQTVKAAVPVFMVVFLLVFFHEVQSVPTYLSVLLTSFGVAIVTVSDATVDYLSGALTISAAAASGMPHERSCFTLSLSLSLIICVCVCVCVCCSDTSV
jgi:drug/metabolite transporter (DMT)-like permease